MMLKSQGRFTLILYVSTSAVNTDFTGKLVDVYPDGYSFNVSDGVVRQQYQSPNQEQQPFLLKRLRFSFGQQVQYFSKGTIFG